MFRCQIGFRHLHAASILIALVMSAGYSEIAFATDLTAQFGVNADVGIDKKTRDWISNLPEEWKSPINQIIEQSLSSVDQHVERDVSKILEQIDAAARKLACQFVGTNKATVDTWKAELPFLRQPEPIRDLDAYIEQQRSAALKQQLNPGYMHKLYDDLQDKVAVIRCEPHISTGSQIDLDAMAATLSSKWTLWSRMDANACGNQDSCFGNYQKLVVQSLVESEKNPVLTAPDKIWITKNKDVVASIAVPSSTCGFFRKLVKADCHAVVDDYEHDLQALATVDNQLRLLISQRELHDKIDAAVITTKEFDPGVLLPGKYIRSPNSIYFAVLQSDCNFEIYKDRFSAKPDPHHLVARAFVPGSATYSNCRLALQRDRNLVLYADITQIQPTMIVISQMTPVVKKNAVVWDSKSSDGGNGDYWLVLLDTGLLEIHAGSPFADRGTIYVSKLLASQAIDFSKSP